MVDQAGRWYPDYPGQQPFQDPAYMRAFGQNPAYGQQNANQQAAQVQTRTVEVVPVENEKSAEEFPVGLGATQMMLARDDSFIAIKSVSVSGQVTFDMYIKRPPAPPEPKFDPREYVRRDELEPLLRDILSPQAAKKKEDSE